MILKTFIKTIKEAGGISGSLDNITYDLFSYVGLNYSIPAIHAALYRKGKNLKIVQGSINEQGFFIYFGERTNSTWTYMQEAFGKLDECGFIDQDTTDQRKFYESLLALFYDILRLVPVSLCNILPPNPLIFGRKRETKQLSDIFRNSNWAIITGIGGIGKSSMALSYAHNLTEHGHWTVQHMICENTDTLQNAISKLQFSDLTDIPKGKKDSVKKNFEMRIACLKNSIKHMLIVLDNLNWPFTSEDRDALKKLMECGSHVRILITSRNRLVDDKRHVINLSPLDESDLLKLYIYHRFEDSENHKEYITQHNDILIKLFSLVEGHTLLVELLAKLPNRTFVGEHEIYNRLASGQLVSLKGISVNKNGKMDEIPKEGLVKMLFDTSAMTDQEKVVMRYLSLIPPAGIEIAVFVELSKCSRSEIHNLIQSNWIILDQERMVIRLHPLICETILSFDDTKPTAENCVEFIDSVKEKRSMSDGNRSAWVLYNKILLCFAENVYFRILASSGMLDCLNGDYRDPLLFLSKSTLRYINSEITDEWTLLNKNNEDTNGDG